MQLLLILQFHKGCPRRRLSVTQKNYNNTDEERKAIHRGPVGPKKKKKKMYLTQNSLSLEPYGWLNS